MIAHNQYHRHGGYVLAHMDLPGFSRQEQGALSVMVRLHRRKYHPELIEDNVYLRTDALNLMTRLLRLAVVLNRGRMQIELPTIAIAVDAHEDMTVEIDEKWLENHPLTAADLDQEVELLANAGLELQILSN